jgi:hypothetical protein
MLEMLFAVQGVRDEIRDPEMEMKWEDTALEVRGCEDARMRWSSRGARQWDDERMIST